MKPVSNPRFALGARHALAAAAAVCVSLLAFASPASAMTHTPKNPGSSHMDAGILENLANSDWSLLRLTQECLAPGLVVTNAFCTPEQGNAQTQLTYVMSTALPAVGVPFGTYHPQLTTNAQLGLAALQTDLQNSQLQQFQRDALSYIGTEYLNTTAQVPECAAFYFLSSTWTACQHVIGYDVGAARTLFNYLCLHYNICPSAFPPSSPNTKHPLNPGNPDRDTAYLMTLGNYAFGIDKIATDCVASTAFGSDPEYTVLNQICQNDENDAIKEIGYVESNLQTTYGVHWIPTESALVLQQDSILSGEIGSVQSLIDSANFLGYDYAGQPVVTGTWLGDTTNGSINATTDCMSLYFNWTVTAQECYHVYFWGTATARDLVEYLDNFQFQYEVGTYFVGNESLSLRPAHH